MTGDEGNLQTRWISPSCAHAYVTAAGRWTATKCAAHLRRRWLLGDVAGHDSTTTIRRRSSAVPSLIEEAGAFDNVRMTNSKEDLVVTGDHGIYYRTHGKAVVDRNPHLVSGTKDAELVTVIADTMRVFPTARARPPITK